MNRIAKSLTLAAILFWPAGLANAWLRRPCEDATVVERSELIVIGHLKPESVQYVPHKRGPNEGASGEHHATLVISEVIKGKSDKKEIPVIIHYGLTPVVGGLVQRDSFMMDVRNGAKDYPKDRIEIHDTGNSARSFRPLVDDAGKDNIWFLRRLSGIYGREPGTGDLGIRDPEDLQPLALKGYFLAYLSADSEAAVKKAMEGIPEARKRGQDYLDHMEVQRIRKMEDASARARQLMPHIAKGIGWGNRDAEAALVECRKSAGPALLEAVGAPEYQPVRPNVIRLLAKIQYEPAGPKLAKVFDDPAFKDCRTDIIGLWGEVRYREAVGILIQLLEEQGRFWEKQKLEKGWWNNEVDSDATKERRQRYGEVYNSVNALNRIGDPAARSIIEQTRRRWQAIQFENPQIVEACDAALKNLPKE